MLKAEGRFLNQRDGKGYAARVTVRIEPHSDKPSIATACSGDGWTGQGCVEEVPAVGYDDWKQGAINGIRYALRAAHCLDCSVVVTRIVGMTTDTNPTIVGAAAIDAV
jgi:hypothetical protein